MRLCPALAQSSLYVGGNANVSLTKITIDIQGNTYAIGTELVTSGTYTPHSVFVAKVDASGSIVFSTRFGGTGDDIATGVGVDSAGRVYGAGYTTSPGFPLLGAIQTNPSAAGSTGFVFSLDPAGQLLWSTYFGGVAPEPHHGGAGSLINAISTTRVAIPSSPGRRATEILPLRRVPSSRLRTSAPSRLNSATASWPS